MQTACKDLCRKKQTILGVAWAVLRSIGEAATVFFVLDRVVRKRVYHHALELAARLQLSLKNAARVLPPVSL